MSLGIQQSAAKFCDMKQDSNPRFGEYENLTVAFDTLSRFWPDKFAIYQWGKEDNAIYLDQREAEWLIDALQKAIAVRAVPQQEQSND